MWRAYDAAVEADLTIRRCWAGTPLTAEDRSTLNAYMKDSFNIISTSAFILWAIQSTDDIPHERLWLVKGLGEPLAIGAYTTAWIAGTDEFCFVKWPRKAMPQIWQLVPFYECMFDDYGCKRFAASDEATGKFNDGSSLEAVRVFRECPFINDQAEFITPLSQVLLNHVDLRTADGDGGFVASFTSIEEPLVGSKLAGNSVQVGHIDVPRLNIVGSAIACGVAVIVFMALSRMSDFDATEVVIEHYDTLKVMYEKGAVDSDDNADGRVNVAGVDNKLDTDVEGFGMKAQPQQLVNTIGEMLSFTEIQTEVDRMTALLTKGLDG
jgi:hypothetical protein